MEKEGGLVMDTWRTEPPLGLPPRADPWAAPCSLQPDALLTPPRTVTNRIWRRWGVTGLQLSGSLICTRLHLPLEGKGQARTGLGTWLRSQRLHRASLERALGSALGL